MDVILSGPLTLSGSDRHSNAFRQTDAPGLE